MSVIRKRYFNKCRNLTLGVLTLLTIILMMPVSYAQENAEEETEIVEELQETAMVVSNPEEAGRGVVQVNLSYIDENGESHIIQGGTGFIIGGGEQNDRQYVITCNHILTPEEELRNEAFLFYEVSKEQEKWNEIRLQPQVVMENDVVTNASIVKASKELDLAVLALDETIHTRTPLSILTSDDGSLNNLPYVVTDKIYALGFPESIRYDSDVKYYANKQVTMSTGAIVNLTQVDGVQMIEHDAEIGENNCGGPLVDTAGRVIGMNVVSRDGSYFCAVDSTTITKVIDAIGLGYDKITTQNLLDSVEPEPEPDPVIVPVIPKWMMYLVIGLMAVILLLFIMLIVMMARNKKNADPEAKEAKRKAKEAAKKEKAKAKIKQPELPDAIREQAPSGQMQNAAGGMDTSVLSVGGSNTTLLGAAGKGGGSHFSGTLIRHKTGENILLNKRIFTIGKDSLHVDYYLKDNSAISRKHAQIRQEADGVYIEDCHSTNGTFVNNRRVSEDHPQILTSGDVIRLGNEEFDYRV